MRLGLRGLAALALVLLLMSATGRAEKLNIEVKEHILANGMKFLVVENHDAPVFSGQIGVKVGSVDEKPGQTGLTHLIEHMLSKGSKIFGTTNYQAEVPLMAQIDSVGKLLYAEWQRLHNPMIWPPDSTHYKSLREKIAQLQEEQKKFIVKDELDKIYLKNGAVGLNAGTSTDGTSYYLSLPTNRLELWMVLESDRFLNVVFREFYSERDVVYEERRLRTDNVAGGKMREQLRATAFASHAYQHPIVGWASDIETYTRPLLEQYFKAYYVPNNTVGVVVGDVKAEEVFRLAEKYFGRWKRGPEPPRLVTTEAPQIGEKRVAVDFDANPSLMIGYHIPAAGHPDLAALDLLSSILADGRTSRMYKAIVEEKKLASSIGAGFGLSRYPDLFQVNSAPLKGRTTEELEQAIYEEIEKAKSEPVSAWELEKVKNQFDAYMIGSVRSNMGLCSMLLRYESLAGTWEYVNKYWEEAKKVTAEDLLRVANKYLIKSNRTVATLVKLQPDKSSAKSGI